ncbi:pre-toxin TG domain-containing protein [Streptomyces sp. NPDC058000]|uniref:pre-toxin TG domain-containing protein n=1 Tax=Streptomyces sp. NPDC058000 TaxID=3346299 RepID=UPI0036EE7A05
MKRASDDPKLLADKSFREGMKAQVAEIKKRNAANLDFWAIQSKEALRSLHGIVSDAKDLKLCMGPLDLGPDWDKTFGPKWDKSFGPGGDMERTDRELHEATRELEGGNRELEDANHEIAQANRELKEANRTFSQVKISIDQMKISIDAGMEEIDRDMAGLRKDVEAMYEIQNRKHPEIWDGVFKDLDLKSVGEYVRDGHMPPEENKLFQAIVSGSLDLTPLAGDAKGVMEAISGKDAVTGQQLSGGERILGSIILFRWLKVGKKVITTEELAKATKAEKATGKIDGWMSRAAYDKVPDSLRKYESFTNKGVGYRWNDAKGNGIRIDKGNLNNSQPYQQVDHVVINSGGKVLGRDGKPLAASKTRMRRTSRSLSG